MGDAKKKSGLGARLVHSLTDIRDTIRSGESLESKYTVRTVILDLDPQEYDAEKVRAARNLLGVSQSLFAQIMGASVDTIASWEQGIREPTPMARRLLDEIVRDKERWRKIIRRSIASV